MSHTGVRGVCPGDRNLDDDTVRSLSMHRTQTDSTVSAQSASPLSVLRFKSHLSVLHVFPSAPAHPPYPRTRPRGALLSSFLPLHSCSPFRARPQVRAIARTGGMVGIGFWSEATCGKTVEDIAKSIVYVMRCALVSPFSSSLRSLALFSMSPFLRPIAHRWRAPRYTDGWKQEKPHAASCPHPNKAVLASACYAERLEPLRVLLAKRRCCRHLPPPAAAFEPKRLGFPVTPAP